MKARWLGISVALSMALPIAMAEATELKVSGAATVGNTVIMPNKAAIEAETGVTLNVTVNGDGNGLKDISGSQCG